MTSIQLADMTSGYKWFRDRKIQVSPGEVYAAGSLAQSEICTTLELVEAKDNLDLVADTEEYTLPEGVANIKGERMLFTASNGTTRELKKRTENEVNYNRNSFPSGNVQFFYVRSENRVVVGFQGIPEAAAEVRYSYYRKPTAAEALSASINPILDSNYDMLLYWGTMKQLLSIYKSENGAKAELGNVVQMYEEKKRDALMMKTKRTYTSEVDYTGLRW